MEDRIPFPLPVKPSESDQRDISLKYYLSRLWRLQKEKDQINLLNQLYEEAYSNGLKAMDKMHGI